MSIDPNIQTASAELVNQTVYLPTFVQKLASAGYTIESEAELVEMIRIGSALRADYEASHNKAANDRVAVLTQLRQQLTGEASTAVAPQQKAAAANPKVFQAVCNLLAAAQ